MSEDGWEPLSPADFAAQVKAATVAPPLEERLRVAQLEGLGPNIRRQLTFLGDPAVIEIQALKVRRTPSDRFEGTRAAHGRGSEETVTLCHEADSWYGNGLYFLTGAIKPGVETRHSVPGRWFDIPKGGGTTDSDVGERLVLPVDFDVKRSSGTSATDEEVARSVDVALSAWKFLSGAVGEQALAYVHSGNGRQIHIALDHLPPEETRAGVAGILAGLGSIFNTEAVVVDETLSDAKRILPACGTLKKKGAPNLAERPHRRTAIVTSPAVKRLSLAELRQLWQVIGEATDDAGKAAMEKAAGVKPSGHVVEVPRNPGSPFDRAKSVDPQKVAEWLGLYDPRGDVRCPGCGSTDGVAVIRYGLKCFHNRCKPQGVNGFYSTVDMVTTAKNVTAIEAVKQLGGQFGFETHFKNDPSPPLSVPSTGNVFEWISTDEIFAPLPPTRWLVKGLHIVAGRPTLLAGYGFSGKTLMAQTLALAMAAKSPVWGFFEPDACAEVRHLDYEQGKHATLKRYQRLSIGHNLTRESLGGRLQVAVFPEVYLDTPGAHDAYARAVDGVGLVVLDALRGATPTIDENESHIRRCLDNLSRVSEKTGTAFVVLHHAGKNRDEGGDARKLPRGSSAIFDACGCVFTVDGESNGPKRVQQTKSPAEAEGGAIDDFHLGIEDVEVEGMPTVGLRVVRLDASKVQAASGPARRFESLKGRVLEVIANIPGLTSANEVFSRMGGHRSDVQTAVGELLRSAAIVQPGGKGTPFLIGGTGAVPGTGTSPVPSALVLVPVPPPLRVVPGTGEVVCARGSVRADKAASKRAAQAESDSAELEALERENWQAHAAAKGWDDRRWRAAKVLTLARLEKIQADATQLAEVRATGVDPQAWAIEHDWPDERTSRAMKKIDEVQGSVAHDPAVDGLASDP